MSFFFFFFLLLHRFWLLKAIIENLFISLTLMPAFAETAMTILGDGLALFVYLSVNLFRHSLT